MFTCLVIYKIIRFSFKYVKQYISPKAQTVFKLFFAFRSFVDFGLSSLGIEYFISVLDFFFSFDCNLSSCAYEFYNFSYGTEK